MKIITTLICVSLILGTPCYANIKAEPSIEKDIIMALVWPYVSKAVSNYYSQYLSGNVNIAPYYGIKIASLDKGNANNETCPYQYLVTVEVEPYIGAHNAVGKDMVKVGVNSHGTEVCGFHHMKSYEVTHPYLKERIIKPLP